MKNLAITSAASSKKQSLIFSSGLWAGIVGPIFFTMVYTLDGLFQPHYSPIAQTISDLAIAENGWIEAVNCVILGLFVILFAFSISGYLRSLIASRWLAISTSLLVVTGIGLLNESLFPTAAPGESSKVFHAVMHIIGFDVIFASLTLACIILGVQFIKNTDWRGIGWYSLIVGLIALVPVCFSLLPSAPVGTHPELHGGLVERIFADITLAWYVVVGIRLLITTRKGHR